VSSTLHGDASSHALPSGSFDQAEALDSGVHRRQGFVGS
jgi:hypothetical protein